MSYNSFYSQDLWPEASYLSYQAYTYAPPTSYRHPAAVYRDRGNAFANYNSAASPTQSYLAHPTPGSYAGDRSSPILLSGHARSNRVSGNTTELQHSRPATYSSPSGTLASLVSDGYPRPNPIASHALGDSTPGHSLHHHSAGLHREPQHSDHHGQRSVASPLAWSSSGPCASLSSASPQNEQLAKGNSALGATSSDVPYPVQQPSPVASQPLTPVAGVASLPSHRTSVPVAGSHYPPSSETGSALPGTDCLWSKCREPSRSAVPRLKAFRKITHIPAGPSPTPTDTHAWVSQSIKSEPPRGLGQAEVLPSSSSPLQTGGQGMVHSGHSAPTDQHNSEPEPSVATRNHCSPSESDRSLRVCNDLYPPPPANVTCGCNRLLGLGTTLHPDVDVTSAGLAAIVYKLHTTSTGECLIDLSRKWCRSPLNMHDIKRTPSGRYDGDHPKWVNAAMVAINRAIREIGVLHGRRHFLSTIPKDLREIFVNGADSCMAAYEAEHRVRGKILRQLGYLQQECQKVLGSLPKARCAQWSLPLHLPVSAFRPRQVTPSPESSKAIFLSAPAVPCTFRRLPLPLPSSQSFVSWLSRRSRISWPPICSAVGRTGQITRFSAPERCFMPTTATTQPARPAHTPIVQKGVADTSRFSLPEKCVTIMEPLAPWARHSTATRPWGSALFRSELRKNLEATLPTDATLSSILDRSLEILRVSPPNSPEAAASKDLVAATPTSSARQDQLVVSASVAWARDPPPPKIFIPPTTVLFRPYRMSRVPRTSAGPLFSNCPASQPLATAGTSGFA